MGAIYSSDRGSRLRSLVYMGRKPFLHVQTFREGMKAAELITVANEQTIFIVEGEKDANALWDLGVPATCNAGGAGKWRDEFAQHLAGANVVVVPDNDDVGRDHAEKVARSLHGIAASVKIVDLPDLPEHGDASDWLAAGGTVEQLEQLANAAAVWAPKARKQRSKKDADLSDIDTDHDAERVYDVAELERIAGPLIECDNALNAFARELRKVVAGEEANAKLLLLVCTSRLLDKPMHAALKGTSAGGKSELKGQVLKFVPPEDVVAFTTLSERELPEIEAIRV